MSTADDGPAAGASGASGRRAGIRTNMAVLWPIAVFDIAGPIIVQAVARNHGASLTLSLVLSGAPPAAGILIGTLRRGRVDAIGVFVLSSILLATVIGLATGSGRLYLLDGAILTGAFGLICLASLAASRPLMFYFALATYGGAESPRGKDFADHWRYAGFRRAFVVITVVWGAGYVLQAAISATIIEATSTQKAFVINKILPYLFLLLLGAWTFVYGMRSKRRGEALAARFAAPREQDDAGA